MGRERWWSFFFPALSLFLFSSQENSCRMMFSSPSVSNRRRGWGKRGSIGFVMVPATEESNSGFSYGLPPALGFCHGRRRHWFPLHCLLLFLLLLHLFICFLLSLFYHLQVLIVGPRGDESAERLFRESLLHKQSVLGQLVIRLDDSSLSNSFLAGRRPSLEAITGRHGKRQLVAGAYLCRNRSCSSTPITNIQDLRQILDQPHTTA